MSIEHWELLWKGTLAGGLALFAGMAVWVTIGGAADIRRLLRRLRAEQERERAGEGGEPETGRSGPGPGEW